MTQPSEKKLDSLECFRCGRKPQEIDEYKPEFTGVDMDPRQYVWEEEGTLNSFTGEFACTDCYIKIGMPTATGGWKPGMRPEI